MRITPAATMAFGGVLIVLLLVPQPWKGRAGHSISDLAHAPVFAVLAALLLTTTRQWLSRSPIRTAIMVWLAVVGFGCVTELMQRFVDRYAEWQDVAANSLGACAGILWTAAPSSAYRGIRYGLRSTAVVLIVAASTPPLLILTDVFLQRLQMPQLASFEQPLELSRWKHRECRINRVRRHATHGSWSLRVDLKTGKYPGAALAWPSSDWSPYDTLVIDAYLEDGPPVNLIVKIQDALHNGEPEDRFHCTVPLVPGRQRIEIALADVAAAPQGRALDLHRVSFLQFFTVRPGRPRTLYLDNIHLRTEH